MNIEPAVLDVQKVLCPKLERVLEYVQASDDVIAASFFADLLIQLNQARTEKDLMHFCFALSTAAFVGIEFDFASQAMTDEILVEAIQISAAFTASPEHPH
jgi:hypothetical protein